MSSEAHRPTAAGGPLSGVRVLELASEAAAFAGKLLADYGADVLLVEPPGGHATRGYAPLAEHRGADPADRSLWFWHYNTSKQAIALDLDAPGDRDRWRALAAHADVVLEAEPVGRLDALGIGAQQLREEFARLVWVSVTPFGRDDPRSTAPSTDLTVMAAGGIPWSCGYDDHAIAPQSSLGGQGHQTASVWAAIGALAALRARNTSGNGQLVDVSMHAAVNVTSEGATHWWMVARRELQRQTGRHAAPYLTDPTVVLAGDGREVHTGFPPRTLDELVRLVQWADDLGLREQLPMLSLLDLAIEQGGVDVSRLLDDEFTQECFRTMRDAIVAIAAHLDAEAFFTDGQRRGFAVGVIRAPDEVIGDAHLVARDYPVTMTLPQLPDRPITDVGLPVRFTGTPGRITPAPRLPTSDALPVSWSGADG